MNTLNFQVQKDSIHTTAVRETPEAPLADGEIRIRIDRFALTANNITYAAFGDAMNYWNFFPTTGLGGGNADGGEPVSWGRIPVWGFGSVTQSSHPGVVVGERLYGYFPMSSSVVLQPTRLAPGSFYDGAAHRAELHPVYNQYMRCNVDPFYTSQTEDIQALLRPLFMTAWLIDDFLADNEFFWRAARRCWRNRCRDVVQRIQQNRVRHGVWVKGARWHRSGGLDLTRQRGVL